MDGVHLSAPPDSLLALYDRTDPRAPGRQVTTAMPVVEFNDEPHPLPVELASEADVQAWYPVICQMFYDEGEPSVYGTLWERFAYRGVKGPPRWLVGQGPVQRFSLLQPVAILMHREPLGILLRVLDQASGRTAWVRLAGYLSLEWSTDRECHFLRTFGAYREGSEEGLASLSIFPEAKAAQEQFALQSDRLHWIMNPVWEPPGVRERRLRWVLSS